MTTEPTQPRRSAREALALMIGQFSDEAYEKPRLGLPSIAEEVADRLIAAGFTVAAITPADGALDRLRAIESAARDVVLGFDVSRKVMYFDDDEITALNRALASSGLSRADAPGTGTEG